MTAAACCSAMCAFQCVPALLAPAAYWFGPAPRAHRASTVHCSSATLLCVLAPLPAEDLFAIALDQPFRFPAAFTFVLRAFATLEVRWCWLGLPRHVCHRPLMGGLPADCPPLFIATCRDNVQPARVVQGIGKALDPGFKFVNVAAPYASELLNLQAGSCASLVVCAAPHPTAVPPGSLPTAAGLHLEAARLHAAMSWLSGCKARPILEEKV